MIRFIVSALISLLSLLTYTASAQSYVFGRADFAVGNLPQAIAAGDFNGDRRLDLAVVNSTDNTVSVLLGKADGTFTPHVDYPTGTSPVSIATGDFNGDGYLDLVITNQNCTYPRGQEQCSPGTVSILLGNGDGTFQSQVESPTGHQPVSVGVGDFNGDGKLDLAVANKYDNTVSILIGRGDGTFQSKVVYTTDPSPLSLVVADFTGDHKLDLAVVTDDSISLFVGKGDGTFQSQITSPASCPLNFFASATAGDFNRDGKLDLAVSCDSGNTPPNGLSIFLGNGEGTFSLLASYPTSGGAITSVDLNGDGILDLATSDLFNFNPVSVLLGKGDGTFQPPATYGAGWAPTSLVAGDFNGDGAIDLAVVDSNSGESLPNGNQVPGAVSVLLGLGNGSFVAATDYAVAGANSVTSADFNGDGDPDLATANYFSNSASVLLGNPDGTFQSPNQFPTGIYPVWIGSSDFNGDGKQDLVTLNDICRSLPCGPGSVSVLLGNGDGIFQAHVDSSTQSPLPISLAIGDFNGDGKPDLAITNNGQVVILLGNGDGTFQYHATYTTGVFTEQVVTGDFNGDGRLDLAVSFGSTNGGVLILLGNGDGTFQAPVSHNLGGAISIAVGDFNADGRLDLAVVGTSTGFPVYVLLGKGDGTFETPVGYPTGFVNESLGSLAVGDLNGDGKLDLAILVGAKTVSILFGNGDGTFQAAVPYLGASTSGVSLTTGDFNRDGGLDLAVADADAGAVAVTLSTPFRAVLPTALNFSSQGQGTTSAAESITVSNPSHVAFTVDNVVASGDFSQNNNCAKLLPGTSCSIDVTFSPTTTGARQGTLTLTDGARVSPQAIPLTGTGVNGPFLTFSPASLNFGGQPLGVPGAKQVVTLINTGNATLSITSIAVGGSNAHDFSQTNNCGSSLAVGGSCLVNVVFTPSALETRQAELIVSDNAPGSPQMTNLEGEGIAAEAALNPTPLNFHVETVGMTSSPENVTLSNPGNETLDIASISITGDFGETNDCGAELAAHSNCAIAVTFTPKTAGIRSGNLTITDNAPNSPQVIPLTGTGANPSLGLGITSGGSSSATVAAGTTAKYSLSIGGGGISGTASLSCTGAPMGATCNVPAIEAVSATTATGFLVSVTTTSRTMGALRPTDFPTSRWLWALALMGWVVFPAGESRKRSARRYLFLLPLLLLMFFCSCGGSSGGSNSSGTPAGTYTLTVTGKAGSTSVQMPLTLKVQ